MKRNAINYKSQLDKHKVRLNIRNYKSFCHDLGTGWYHKRKSLVQHMEHIQLSSEWIYEWIFKTLHAKGVNFIFLSWSFAWIFLFFKTWKK